MKTRRFLTLFAVFATLFMNFGTLSAQSEINLKYLKTLKERLHLVESVCWSPDGKYLASGSFDDNVIIWDAKSGEKLQTLKGHSNYVRSVCWSPDGKYLASGSDDKTVKIWDANSGNCIRTLEEHSREVFSISWSPDGKYLAGGAHDHTVIIWDAKSGEKLQTLEGHSDDVKSVSWSPDGKYLASGSSQFNGVEYIGCVKIWDAIGGKEIQTLHRHSYEVESVCWSPDGKYLASGSTDETVIIWSVEDDKETVEINYNSLFKGGRVKKGSGGDGVGGGPSFSLAGRGAKSWGKISSSSEKVGNVVVEIKVDKDGNVIEAKAGQRGTTLWDSNLWRECEQAVRKSKFTANPDAPEVQKGTVTYIFR